MNVVTDSEINWAKILLSEITSDDNCWWNPVSESHQIFEQCYMMFVNKNLNYFNFENMLLSLIEGYEYNPSLPKTLEFCKYVRTITGDIGPFGRMCVWNVPPRATLLLHRDSFRYHSNIIFLQDQSCYCTPMISDIIITSYETYSLSVIMTKTTPQFKSIKNYYSTVKGRCFNLIRQENLTHLRTIVIRHCTF